METLTIQLPVHLKSLLEDEFEEAGHESLSEYVVAILIEHQQRKNKESLDPILQDPENRKRIEALLVEGLQSEFSEMTDEDWREIRRRALDRLAAKASP